MKKIAILLFALCIATGAVMAQEGLYVGGELGIADLENADKTMSVKPYVGYSAEIIENFELSAELAVPMWFEPDFGMNLELEIGVQYSFGIFYVGLNVPMLLFSSTDGVDPFDDVGLNLVIGLETEAGFGGEVIVYNTLASEAEFFNYLDITAFYQMEALYFGLTFGLPLYEDGMDIEGLTITPEIAYDISENLNLYLQVPVGGIGASGDVGIGLTLGVKFSF